MVYCYPSTGLKNKPSKKQTDMATGWSKPERNCYRANARVTTVCKRTLRESMGAKKMVPHSSWFFRWLLFPLSPPSLFLRHHTRLLSTPSLFGCKMSLFRSKPKYYFLFSHWLSLNSLTNKITVPFLPLLFLSRLDVLYQASSSRYVLLSFLPASAGFLLDLLFNS
jgi:hypothetical protein